MLDNLFDERRLVSRVLRHWQEMAIGRNLPSKDNIDPWLVGDDWSYCTLLTLNAVLPKSIFLTVGSNLLPAGTPSLNSRPISECPAGTILAAMLAELDRSISTSRPLCIESRALHLESPVIFRAILLPLSNDGSQIDSIFGAANFRPLAPNEHVGLHKVTAA
jgi:hypothetical protein